VHTQFVAIDLETQVRAHLDGVERVEVHAMPLRTIFTSLARATQKQGA
jgi:hypothetical protein